MSSLYILPFTIQLLSAPKIPLTFPNFLPGRLPPFHHCRPPLRRQLVQRRPIYLVFILEIHIPTMRFQQLDWRDEKPQIVVKFQFFPSCRVDEGVDEFEKGLHNPGN